jgi:YbbR domain-containing protein
MKNVFTNNLVLKLIALGLAVITFIYVNNELIK